MNPGPIRPKSPTLYHITGGFEPRSLGLCPTLYHSTTAPYKCIDPLETSMVIAHPYCVLQYSQLQRESCFAIFGGRVIVYLTGLNYYGFMPTVFTAFLYLNAFLTSFRICSSKKSSYILLKYCVLGHF